MNIQELRRLCDKATPGRWYMTRNAKTGAKIWGADMRPICGILAHLDQCRSDKDGKSQWQIDAEFIRLARTALPLLLDVAEAAEGLRRVPVGNQNRWKELAHKLTVTLDALKEST